MAPDGMTLTQHSAAHRAVLGKLQRLLPDDCVITDAAGLHPYETDGLTAIREMPWVVALPETEEQVTAIVLLRRARGGCDPRGLAQVCPAARDPISRVSCWPIQDGTILAVDPENRIARVQPGVRNLAITQAAEEHGLYYAPDPSSQIACVLAAT